MRSGTCPRRRAPWRRTVQGTANRFAHDVTLGRPGYVGTDFGFNGSSSAVVVQSSSTLNPGRHDFSYAAAVRLSVLPRNVGDTYDVMRKGISTTSGGEHKMEIVNVHGTARARCTTKDAGGHLARETHGASLADGAGTW